MAKHIPYFFYLCSIFLLFNSVKTQIVKENLTLSNEGLEVNLIEGDKYYYVSLNSTADKYLLIIVLGENYGTEEEHTNYINHVISFYKDSEFLDRKQLAQSQSEMSFMHLNKEQVGEDFYLSVECAKTPCKYNLSFTWIDIPELLIGVPYTYFVSKENIKMEFALDASIMENYGDDYLILFYAKGSKYITTKIEGATYSKHRDYDAYLISGTDNEEQMVYLTVESRFGELINVGALLFEKDSENSDNALFEEIIDNGIETTGFIKKGVLEKNCFKIPKEKGEPVEINVVPYDKVLIYNTFSEYNDDYNLKCINFTSFDNDYDQIDELFYSIQFIFDYKDDGQGLNKYPIIFPDTYYTRKYHKGNILVLDQLEPEDDYKYLSLMALSNYGDIKLYLYKCTNYPLCTIDSKAIEDSILIHHFYNLYTYSITKKEIGENITVISKTQHYFLLTCEDGFQETEDSQETCAASYVSYTNKDKIPTHGYNLIYGREGDENHFYPFLYNELAHDNETETFVDIKIFTGDVSVTTSKPYIKTFEYKSNKVFYIKPEKDLFFSIKSNINSIYSIEVYNNKTSYPIKDAFHLGEGMYLFKFDGINSMEIYPNFLFTIGDVPDYTAFYPINCKITLERGIRNNTINSTEKDEYSPINERYGFYQELIIPHNENITQLGFRVNNTDSLEDCMFAATFDTLEEDANENKRGIVLYYNNSLPFIFETNYTKAYFLYPFSPNNSDFSINFIIRENAKYKVGLFLNNLTINKAYDIDSNYSIEIKKEDWEELCSDIKQICLLSFSMNSENQEESKIDIIIKSLEEDKQDDFPPEEEDDENEEEDNENEEEDNENEEEDNENEEEDEEEDNENEEEDNENEEEEENNNHDPEESDEESSKKLGAGYIILIALGGFIVIVLLIFIILKCRNKNTKDDIEKANIEEAFSNNKEIGLINK